LLPPNRQIYFYRTHDGAEVDLVVIMQQTQVQEIKFGSDARPSRGNTEAIQTLKTQTNFIITKNDDDYILSGGFRICGLRVFLSKYLQKL
jgi:predicted AAA+ superfamily ATPase